MINYKMSMQNIPDSHVCSTDKSKPKSINTDKSKPKRVNFNACSTEKSEPKRVDVNTCSTDERESKSVHKMDIIMNKRNIKDTKDEEPSVMDILLIKAPGYFELFECGKYFFNNLDTMYEHACMENVKNDYWTEMYDVITNYNVRNHTPLSNLKIIEAIDKLIMEKQAEANNFMADTFSI